jgi:hypothetical protein
MKKFIRTACILSIAVGINQKATAEEYLRLSTNLGGSKYIVFDRKSSSFNETFNTYEYGVEVNEYAKSEMQDIAKGKNDSFKLSDGEAIELTKPIFIVESGSPAVPEEFPNENDGDNWRWSAASWGGKTHTIYADNGNASRLYVKFPESEKWHQLYYHNDQWNGMGTENPVIAGPCEIKLVTKPKIYLMKYAPNNNNHDSNHRYAAYCNSFVSWVFMRKIAVGSSSGTTTKAQSIVLPEGSGDLSIIMEGSNDLINWTREDLGKKPEANRKTFYRIRAVKE